MPSSGVLPGKNKQQCYLQTQRILGQQSLAEFLGLHLDVKRLAEDLKRVPGMRKNGQLVNTGDKLTKEELEKKLAANKAKYGLTEEEIARIKLPRPTCARIFKISAIMNPKNDLSTIDKINHLLDLEKELQEKLARVLEAKSSRGTSAKQSAGKARSAAALSAEKRTPQ